MNPSKYPSARATGTPSWSASRAPARRRSQACRGFLAAQLALALACCVPKTAPPTGLAASGAGVMAAQLASQNPSVRSGPVGPGLPVSAVAGMQSPPSRDAGVGSVAGAAATMRDSSVVNAPQSAAAGAAVPTAGTAAASGAGAPAPSAAGCVGSGFALCEDFEGGTLDAKLWKLTQAKGMVTIDASRGARGSTHSAHVHVDSGSDTTVGLTESKTFPTLEAGLIARAFIFIPSTMTDSLFKGDRHSRLIYAQGATPYGEYALGIWNGGLIQNHYSESDDSQDTKMLPPFDEWFCLEYELNSAAGEVKAYLNDVEITALRHEGWPPSNIDTLMFGVDRYGSFPVAEDLWFDELVADNKHIGCTR